MNRRAIFTSTVIAAALTLSPAFADAQARNHQGGGNRGNGGGGGQAAARQSGGGGGQAARQSAPARQERAPQTSQAPAPRQERSQQMTPRSEGSYAPRSTPRYEGNSRPSYQGAPSYNRPSYQGVPSNNRPSYQGSYNRPSYQGRSNVRPNYDRPGYQAGSSRYYGGDRGRAVARPYGSYPDQYSRSRSYSSGAYGYSRPYYYSRPYVRPYGYSAYRPYYFSRPYYSFRPRFSIGFGLYIGEPIAYPWDYLGSYSPRLYGSYSVAPSQSLYGGVSFDMQPSDADLFVDGEYVGPVGNFNPNGEPLTLTPGTHRIAVQCDGYRSMEWEVTIEPGQVIPYRGDLER